MTKLRNQHLTKKKTDIDPWKGKMTSSQKKALASASRVFKRGDLYNMHTLEAIYAQESSFGKNLRRPGMNGAAGHFQHEKKTAQRLGMIVTKKNDERFKIKPSAKGEAQYIMILDGIFKKGQSVSENITTISIRNSTERKNFVIAALNGGEGRIAKAQQATKKAGKDSGKWGDVKKFLEKAGALKVKVKEISDFVDRVLSYEKQFSDNCHWITKNGRHICIE